MRAWGAEGLRLLLLGAVSSTPGYWDGSPRGPSHPGPGLLVEQYSCIGAGGDSGAADWGPEPVGVRIATWFWEVIS